MALANRPGLAERTTTPQTWQSACNAGVGKAARLQGGKLSHVVLLERMWDDPLRGASIYTLDWMFLPWCGGLSSQQERLQLETALREEKSRAEETVQQVEDARHSERERLQGEISTQSAHLEELKNALSGLETKLSAAETERCGLEEEGGGGALTARQIANSAANC